MSMTQFHSHQMLTNRWIEEEREAIRSKVIPCDEEEENVTVHELVHSDRGHCRMCSIATRWRCARTPQSGTADGKKQKKCGSYFLCTAPKQRCFIMHIEGVTPQKLKATVCPKTVQ